MTDTAFRGIQRHATKIHSSVDADAEEVLLRQVCLKELNAPAPSADFEGTIA